ncbi:alpha/beta fold hydrolase [Viridibacterium curvum]
MRPAPYRTPEQSAQAFLTPRRSTRAAAPFLPEARTVVVDGPVGKLVGRLVGEGPCVLLLHRWEGAASELGNFVPPLLAAGFSVLALDLPAHGASEGEQVSIPMAAKALLMLQDELGPQHRFHAGIGHSLGAAVLIHAMALGCRIDRAALLAAPAHAEDYVRDYCLRDGLDDAQTEQMLDILRDEHGVDIRAISMPVHATRLSQPALFVHADDDRVIPHAASVLTASHWRGAELMTVQGLGHARLLRDPGVVARVTAFVSATTD